MASAPHISDVTSGNVVICGACGGTNLKDSAYCRECGWSLSALKIPANAARGGMSENGRAEASDAIENRGDAGRADRQDEGYETSPSGEISALSPVPAEPRQSLLEKLDLMERELEARKQEALPEPEQNDEFDHLDEHEQTLKNIAFRLDALISDLMKAEAQEYAFADSPRIEGKSFEKNDAAAKRRRLKIKVKNPQEIIVMLALIAAIFLVGMTFGLWGSYFFGI
jgi:hypothetical protein